MIFTKWPTQFSHLVTGVTPHAPHLSCCSYGRCTSTCACTYTYHVRVWYIDGMLTHVVYKLVVAINK